MCRPKHFGYVLFELNQIACKKKSGDENVTL